MTSTTVRLGSLTAVLALAMSGPLGAASTFSWDPSPAAAPAAKPSESLQTSAPRYLGRTSTEHARTGIAVPLNPTLPLLVLPAVSLTMSPQGFAGQDLLVDVDPDLVDMDFDIVLQRLDGETWVEAAAATTSGAADHVVLPALPAGTYRVVVPKQHGLAEHVSEPYSHQPRQLSVNVGFDRGSTTTTVDIDPDPTTGGYDFTLEKKDGDEWRFVSTRTTSDAGATQSFADLPSGTYRVVVPDQADALGAVSQEVEVVSSADLRAAAERAAAARAAQSGSGTTSRSTASPAPVSGGASYGSVVSAAMAQVGSAYRLGASGNGAFDCSGLTSFAYRSVGISLPHNANAQYAATRRVSNPQPGDLVLFLNGASHVGIYIGNGQMVHAANPSRGVEVTSFTSGWYGRAFTGYGRP